MKNPRIEALRLAQQKADCADEVVPLAEEFLVFMLAECKTPSHDQGRSGSGLRTGTAYKS